MKTCTKCGEEKDASLYGKRASTKDGLAYECVDCARKRARDNYVKNREAIKARANAYHHANKEQVAERHARYYAANKDRFKEYRRKNRDRDAATQAERRRTHAQSRWAREYRKAARRFNLTSPVIEPMSLPEVVAEYGDACFYCGGPFEHLDHYVPVSKGGNHTLSNVRPACGLCNMSKQDKDADDWSATKEEK